MRRVLSRYGAGVFRIFIFTGRNFKFVGQKKFYDRFVVTMLWTIFKIKKKKKKKKKKNKKKKNKYVFFPTLFFIAFYVFFFFFFFLSFFFF